MSTKPNSMYEQDNGVMWCESVVVVWASVESIDNDNMDVGWVCGNGGAMEVFKLLFDLDEKMNGRCNIKKNDFLIFV